MMTRLFLVTVLLISSACSLRADDFPVLTGSYLGQEPPGDEPRLFAPGVVSTGKEHSAAMFTPDGNEIWLARLFPSKMYFLRLADGRWTEPRMPAFSETYDCLYPMLSPDGSAIFFSSNRPVERNGERLGGGGVHIWMVRRTADGWSVPRRLSDKINFGRRNSCGGIAANGNLYFSAGVAGDPPDIYRSVLINGRYSDPEPLIELDSPTPDHCPFVAPDESYLILSSFRGGLGRSDLFISFRGRGGTWTKPKTMGSRINSAYKDEYPYVTPDGEYLFFNSNRPSAVNEKPIPDGPGNIYWVSSKIIEELRPQEAR